MASKAGSARAEHLLLAETCTCISIPWQHKPFQACWCQGARRRTEVLSGLPLHMPSASAWCVLNAGV